MPDFIFAEGPQGRNVLVNENGALVANGGSGPFLPYQFGPKGRAITVDGSGRLAISLSAPAFQTTPAAASGAFNLGSGTIIDLTLDQSFVFTSFDAPTAGGKYTFILEQDGAGSFTVTWPSNVKWRGGSAPTLTTASGSIDVVTMLYREKDSTFLADVGLNFS